MWVGESAVWCGVDKGEGESVCCFGCWKPMEELGRLMETAYLSANM
jgi:hypothetical protein